MIVNVCAIAGVLVAVAAVGRLSRCAEALEGIKQRLDEQAVAMDRELSALTRKTAIDETRARRGRGDR